VGTKADLRDNPAEIEALKAYGKLPVSYDKGMKTSKEINARGYVDCSAFQLIGVDEAFIKAVRLIVDKHSMSKKSKNYCSLL
jgi:Ras-related C3 botulinum toxin substrate 1